MSYYLILYIVAALFGCYFIYIFIRHYLKADKKARKGIIILYAVLACVTVVVMIYGVPLRHLIFPFIEDRPTFNGAIITPTELPLEKQEHIKDTFEIK